MSQNQFTIRFGLSSSRSFSLFIYNMFVMFCKAHREWCPSCLSMSSAKITRLGQSCIAVFECASSYLSKCRHTQSIYIYIVYVQYGIWCNNAIRLSCYSSEIDGTIPLRSMRWLLVVKWLMGERRLIISRKSAWKLNTHIYQIRIDAVFGFVVPKLFIIRSGQPQTRFVHPSLYRLCGTSSFVRWETVIE